ncbi:hypothetical protein ACIHIX_34590 [Streptomyces sp. NPDC051913]|uniref:hypothetical protein n=1 Tax=Streptomyces sp. NPDC051913 TaxID=3365676 RepID=UPI0037D3B01E
MNAVITRDMLDEGTHARESLEPPGFLGGDCNQARGHLLARMLGGSGDTLVNTRTKKIMRQMHGRAGFDLLRHRILLQ